MIHDDKMANRIRSALIGLALCLAASLMPAETRAHPHVFVEARAELVFDDQGRLTEIRHRWTFDEFFSAYAIEGLDTDGDGIYSRAELDPLAEVNVTSLEEFGFFTFAGTAENEPEFGQPRDYWLDHDNGLLTLNYTLPFDGPVAMTDAAFMVDIYDPEYFVAFSLATSDPVAASNMPESCRLEVDEPEELDAATAITLSEIPSDVRELPPELAMLTIGLANRVTVLCSGEDPAVAAAPVQRTSSGGPFGVTLPEPGITPGFGGPLAPFFAWVASQQQAVYRQLAGLVQGFRENPISGLWLIGLSFLYGVLHAAGPGHGKAVITSYLLARGETVKRGIVLAFASATLQALVAIALVAIMAGLLSATSAAMTRTAGLLEVASYALITLVGAWLIFGRVRALLRSRRRAISAEERWRRDDDPGLPARSLSAAAHHHDRSHHQAHHSHDHVHGPGGVCTTCGHSHMPDPRDLEGPFSLAKAWNAVLAVGLRPCTGAILVLVFCFAQGLAWLGVASALAMALGTAITVSILAALAVGAKDLATRIAGADTGVGRGVTAAIEITAAGFVMILGLMLLGGALAGGVPGVSF